MVISVTWCVLKRFCGAWDLFSRPLVSCSLGTMSTVGRMELRYAFHAVSLQETIAGQKNAAIIFIIIIIISIIIIIIIRIGNSMICSNIWHEYNK